MQSDDIEYMRMALAAAQRQLEQDLMPVGAVVVSRDKTIIRTSEKGFKTPYLEHAEMVALQEALPIWRSKDDRITVYTRLEPCLMCTAFMLHTRVDKIVYGLEDPAGGAMCIVHSHDMPPRHQSRHPEIVSGVLREESRLLLRQWFLSTKNEYWRSATTNPFYKLCME